MPQQSTARMDSGEQLPSVDAPTPRTSRAERTRARILTAAERLFARHGIDGVSLNTINEASRQRNKNAIHYHFGGRKGLLQAIFDKHSPGIARRRRELLDALPDPEGAPLAKLVEALVIPVAEKLQDAAGGTAYVHISAELVARNTLSYYLQGRNPLRYNREERLSRLLEQRLQLPRPLLETRMMLATSLLFHGLSDHARLCEAEPDGVAALLDPPLFVRSLIDAIQALLEAPASPGTRALLERQVPQ